MPPISANTHENKITIVKDTDKLTILKLENNEILEHHKVEGNEYFIARTNDEDIRIERHGNKVHHIDLETNQVVRIVEPTIEYETEIEDSEVISPYMNDTGGAGGGYKHIRTRKMSMDAIGLGASIIAGTIASYAFKSKAAGSLVAAVSSALAAKLPKVYWTEARYERSQSIWKYTKTIVSVYKYHDYTVRTGGQTAVQKYRRGLHG